MVFYLHAKKYNKYVRERNKAAACSFGTFEKKKFENKKSQNIF